MALFTTYLPYFVLVLTLLVFVHEYGHYWVGRRFGIHAQLREQSQGGVIGADQDVLAIVESAAIEHDPARPSAQRGGGLEQFEGGLLE